LGLLLTFSTPKVQAQDQSSNGHQKKLREIRVEAIGHDDATEICVLDVGFSQNAASAMIGR